MKVIADVSTILASKNIPAKKTMKRSIAFPRRMPRLFSTWKTVLRVILNELNTHVEAQINPPMPNTPTIFRSRMIVEKFFMIL
ncbi:MAG: hypothetical protein Q8N70_09825, partial [Deltaproteobacteria bacterium]|nr:hypothetical protein [Deltaproteobacteria bacterium]